MYSQKATYDIASISETTKPINKKFQDNIVLLILSLTEQHKPYHSRLPSEHLLIVIEDA